MDLVSNIEHMYGATQIFFLFFHEKNPHLFGHMYDVQIYKKVNVINIPQWNYSMYTLEGDDVCFIPTHNHRLLSVKHKMFLS